MVIADVGGGDPRDRLLHRRDDRSQDALRPVLHRVLDAARPPGRRDREPGLGVGHPAGAEPRHRGAAIGCAVPRARPGTPSSQDPSMRCSGPRASASSEPRSGHGRPPIRTRCSRGSWQAATTAGASSGRHGRTRTTPSLRLASSSRLIKVPSCWLPKPTFNHGRPRL